MRWLWVILLVTWLVGPALAQEFTVGRIEIVGNTHVPTREILGAVRFEVGQVVTREEVLSAVQSVQRLGYFPQVTPELAFDDDLVVVRFRVVEYPKVERIVFEGLPPAPRGRGTLLSWLQDLIRGGNRPTETRLREILTESGVKAGSVLNQIKIEAALAALADEYQKKDWATVQIIPDLRGSDLVFIVEELLIAGHRFRGLATVPEEEARRLVSVPVGEAGRISQIQETLGAFGRSVFFASSTVGWEMTPEGVWLIWELEERVVLPAGASLSGITLAGVTAFPPARMDARLGPMPDRQATNLDVLRALEPVFDYYRREGYFMVDLVGEGLQDGLLRVLVKEGRVGRVEIGEDSRTAPWVIERVMDLPPGQFLTEGRFVAARQSLMALGYFRDVVLEPRWAADELVLKVTVSDMDKLGSIGGNVAFSPQDQGIVGNVTYSQKNVLGRAIDLDVSLETGLTGSGATTWSLGFRSHSFPVFDLVSLNFYRRAEGDDPATITLGGGATVAYPLAHYLDLFVSLSSERAWEIPESVLLDPKTSVEVGLSYDDRDSPFFPRTGGRGRASVEKAGTFAPGVEFLALRGEWSAFSPVDLSLLLRETRAVVAWRIQGRWGWDLPERYQFTLGGGETVRGAKSIRTDRYGLLNTEFRVEIAQGSWVAAFGDFGSTWDGVRKASWGVELAASVAGMFVRLALAWPDDRDPTWVPAFEFGMSPMF